MRKVFGQTQRHFTADEKGTIAPMFGLMATVFFLMVGLAVDFARWHQAKQATKAATDAAVLAAGRALQVNGADVDGALAAAQKYYQMNIQRRIAVENDTITFVLAESGAVITVQGNAYVKTTLMALGGIDRLPLLDESGADFSVARIAIGKNSGQNIEISLMLDVTGSMEGQKLTDMQDAAKDLINIVVWNDQSLYTSKVALVPFSQAVNLGSTYFTDITGENTDSELASVDGTNGYFVRLAQQALTAASGAMTAINPIQPAFAGRRRGRDRDRDRDDDDDGDGDPGVTYGPCAVDRTGPDAHTDAAPGAGNYIQAYDIARNNNDTTRGQPCRPEGVTIMPLSSDKTALKAKIDTFVADGWTAGAVGTAFAWYMLSPNWSDIWPEESEPAAYEDAGTKKIAILMTDGVYNVAYNGSDQTPSEQAVAICTGMKAKGIEVYTVGFELGGNQTAIDTLASCATDPSHAYIANNGNDLKHSFRDIALKTTDLYLSK